MNAVTENREKNEKGPNKNIQYWCHTCRNEFTLEGRENSVINCKHNRHARIIQLGIKCGRDFCEEIDPSEMHPKHFVPFSSVEIRDMFIYFQRELVQNQQQNISLNQSHSPARHE
jgi:hypothetical protein